MSGTRRCSGGADPMCAGRRRRFPWEPTQSVRRAPRAQNASIVRFVAAVVGVGVGVVVPLDADGVVGLANGRTSHAPAFGPNGNAGEVVPKVRRSQRADGVLEAPEYYIMVV